VRGAVFSDTFCVEPIGLWGNQKLAGRMLDAYLCYCSRLVVPSNQLDSVWVSQLETCEERNGFDAEETAVDVVTWNR